MKPKKFTFNLQMFFCVAILLSTLPFLSLSAQAASIGEVKTFLVDTSYDFSSRSEVKSTLRKIGSSTYFYVEDDYFNGLDASLKTEFDSILGSLASDFDNIIYPRIRETFGQEWNPGIDSDAKITVLFTKTKENVGGYFNPNDEYKKEEIIGGRSNEMEMIYLNAAFWNNKRIKSFFAHEFQHMITWYYKTKLRNISDDIWLNEARSEYASTAIGYDDDYFASNLMSRVKNFLSSPDDSLTEWKNDIYDYSSVNLFSQYLADHFGKNIFKAMINNNEIGIQSINKALVDSGYSDYDFREIFTNWTVSNYLNDKSLSIGNKYGYLNPNLSFENFHFNATNSYTVNGNITINVQTAIKDWSGKYYEFKIAEGKPEEKNVLKIAFDGEDNGRFSVPYIVFYSGGTKQIGKLNLDGTQNGSITISNIENNISSVLLVPSSQKQESGFGSSVEGFPISISVNLQSFKSLYPNGSLLKTANNPRVYLIENDKKRWITSADVFASSGYQWKNIIVVPQAELELYERGEDLIKSNLLSSGSLIKGTKPEVYLVEDGKKRWITSADVFMARSYKWEDIVQISDRELELYAEGENVSVTNLKNDGSLIKGIRPEVYLIEDGKKRWIVTARIFALKGYKWDKIIAVSDSELNLYPVGEDVK